MTTPPNRMERIATGEQVYVQRHLATIDLGSDACRTALVHQGMLICGTLNGDLVTLDLQTGRKGSYNLMPRSKVVSTAWSMVTYADRLLLHTGGEEWLEVNPQTGQRLRSGRFPEAGLNLFVVGDWLYLTGGRRLYRQSLIELGRRAEEFALSGRVAGLPMMERGTLFIPTSTGPLRLMPGSDLVDLFGPQEPARTVTRLSGRRLVVVYPIVSAEGNQNSRIRWFDTTPEMNLLGEMNFGGLTIGLPQIAEDWMILPFQDGRLIGCQFEDDSRALTAVRPVCGADGDRSDHGRADRGVSGGARSAA
jgi:hypothetical protein